FAAGGRPDHLSDALGLSVGSVAGALRERLDGAPVVPALRRGRRARAAVGAAGARVRGVGRAGVALAGGRRGDGEGALRRRKKGPNPTDRAKPGTKKSVVVDADGGPLGAVIAGANVHDTKLLADTLDAIVLERPDA